jgi:hypothetical protein
MEPFVSEDDQSALRQDIESAINRHSRENASDTPDFLLAEYLTDCLAAYEKATRERERWYGRYVHGKPGAPGEGPFPRIANEAPAESSPSLPETP